MIEKIGRTNLFLHEAVIIFILFNTFLFSSDKHITLNIGGTKDSTGYITLLLERTLEAAGYIPEIINKGEIPMSRLEFLLEYGEVTVLILGETPARSERFLKINAGITDNLMGNRILFIPKGMQKEYNKISTIDDFVKLNKIAGMGESWGDVLIWEFNGLKVHKQSGDWKNLYRMVAGNSRGIDYLTRGVQEMSREWSVHHYLDVEENLVFVYNKDHVMYVSPEYPEIYKILKYAILKAEKSGIIKKTAREYYSNLHEPPINLHKRRVIKLKLPE